MNIRFYFLSVTFLLMSIAPTLSYSSITPREIMASALFDYVIQKIQEPLSVSLEEFGHSEFIKAFFELSEEHKRNVLLHILETIESLPKEKQEAFYKKIRKNANTIGLILFSKEECCASGKDSLNKKNLDPNEYVQLAVCLLITMAYEEGFLMYLCK